MRKSSLKLIAPSALAVVILALAAAGVAVGAMVPPIAPIPIPTVPDADPGDTAKFKLTIRGMQTERSSFYRDPGADGCSLRIEGTFNEAWEYWRSTGVTIEFNRYGKRIYMKRSGRQLGDTAFATKGSLLRTATGFHQIFIPPGCHSFTLVDPSCGQKVKAPLDMRLDWGGGKLRIKHSGPAAAVPNPAEPCELIPGSGSTIDELTNPYPFLARQSARLSARTIFGKKRTILLHLKDNFLRPLYVGGFTTFNETLAGGTTITLRRQ